jgi:hypothetical protein
MIMKIALSEVFCEVVSAFGFVLTFIPVFLLLQVIEMNDISRWMSKIAGPDLLWIGVLAYILGVFLNIIGLPADIVLGRLGISGQNPPQESKRKFYTQASQDLFNFRTNAWVHYYCFRNLLIFCPFAFILWAWVACVHWGYLLAVFMGLGIAVLGVLLYFAVKEHAAFYEEVTKTFD